MNIPDARRPQKKTVRSRYVLGWIIVKINRMAPRFWQQYNFAHTRTITSCKVLSFYIEHGQSYCISTKAWFEFVRFKIVTIISFHAFCMLYHVCLCSCHPCDITLLIFFFIINYIIRKKLFLKWSIKTWSIPSKVNQHLESHQISIKQVYKKGTFDKI